MSRRKGGSHRVGEGESGRTPSLTHLPSFPFSLDLSLNELAFPEPPHPMGRLTEIAIVNYCYSSWAMYFLRSEKRL